jgi:succinate dehydrogenase / fumarate reductase membrane anchor subunit
MKTALKKVKALGTAHNGVHHWWAQRITAIALIPLVVWFTNKVICTAHCHKNITMIFEHEFSFVIFALMLFILLYHSALGVKVIIEDYVNCKCAKTGAIIGVNLLAWLTGALLFFALIKNLILLNQ